MENTAYTDEQRLRVIREYIDKMPSLSTTVTKVLEICNRPNTASDDLNKVISIDPVLTGNILKLINSAYYSLSNQVTSLRRAIIMLGINTVKNLALSSAILGTLKSSGELQSLPMDIFWAHGLCVGVAAKSIAARINIPIAQHEEFFVAGLLHDLGKVALNSCFPQEYGQTMALAELDQGPLYRAEETILGLQHALAGQRIAEKWQFGKTIMQTIAFHHRPKAASKDVQEVVAIVALANIYANIYAYGSAGDMFPCPIDLAEVLDMVGMNWKDMQHLEETVSTEIEKAKIFLQIGAGETS